MTYPTTEYLTLVDYQAHPMPLVSAVIKVLRANSLLMDVMPWPTKATQAIETRIQAGIAQPSWRKKGSSHGSVKGPTSIPYNEQVFSIGNEISVDKLDFEDKRPRFSDPFTDQTNMIVEGIAREVTDKIITGVPTDKDNLTGLIWRIANILPAAQTITSDPAGSTAGLDLSYDASGLAANIQTFVDKLDALIYRVADDLTAEGKGIYLLMNDTSKIRCQSLLRQSGLLQTTTDSLGRVFDSYKGAKFLDVGYKTDETNASDGTRIMPNTETVAGALTGGAATSIIACRFGEQYFTGWQMYEMMVTDLELEPVHKMAYVSVIDWAIGVAMSHPRSAARLYGLTMA